jgi:hypothetical protein
MTRSRLIIGGALIFCVVSSSSAQNRDATDELVQQFLEAIPPDTITNAQAYETNGFQVQSSQNRELGADFQPTGNQMQFLTVTAEGIFKVGIEKGRPMSTGGGIGIFHRESGAPMLTAGDQDGDGRIDILTYGVFDENGEHVLEIIDYEADGQADVKIHFGQGFYEVWHIDRWYRAENRDGIRGIIVGGDFREIRNIDNRLTVQ